MEIILVRHSIAQGNPERRFLGVTDTPLLPEGIALAERRAAAMHSGNDCPRPQGDGFRRI